MKLIVIVLVCLQLYLFCQVQGKPVVQGLKSNHRVYYYLHQIPGSTYTNRKLQLDVKPSHVLIDHHYFNKKYGPGLKKQMYKYVLSRLNDMLYKTTHTNTFFKNNDENLNRINTNTKKHIIDDDTFDNGHMISNLNKIAENNADSNKKKIFFVILGNDKKKHFRISTFELNKKLNYIGEVIINKSSLLLNKLLSKLSECIFPHIIIINYNGKRDIKLDEMYDDELMSKYFNLLLKNPVFAYFISSFYPASFFNHKTKLTASRPIILRIQYIDSSPQVSTADNYLESGVSNFITTEATPIQTTKPITTEATASKTTNTRATITKPATTERSITKLTTLKATTPKSTFIKDITTKTTFTRGTTTKPIASEATTIKTTTIRATTTKTATIEYLTTKPTATKLTTPKSTTIKATTPKSTSIEDITTTTTRALNTKPITTEATTTKTTSLRAITKSTTTESTTTKVTNTKSTTPKSTTSEYTKLKASTFEGKNSNATTTEEITTETITVKNSTSNAPITKQKTTTEATIIQILTILTPSNISTISEILPTKATSTKSTITDVIITEVINKGTTEELKTFDVTTTKPRTTKYSTTIVTTSKPTTIELKETTIKRISSTNKPPSKMKTNKPNRNNTGRGTKKYKKTTTAASTTTKDNRKWIIARKY